MYRSLVNYQSVQEFHAAFAHDGGTIVIDEQTERDKGARKKYHGGGGQNKAKEKRTWLVVHYLTAF